MANDDLAARVAAAAEALEAEGIRPTSARVRERVQASANRVHPLFQAWRDRRRATERPIRELPPAAADLPVPPALRAAVDAILAVHSQILALEIERERAAATAVRKSLAAQFEAELSAARDAAAEAEADSAALVEAANAAEERAEKLEAEHARLASAQVDLRAQLADLARRAEAAEARAAAAETRAHEESAARAGAEQRQEAVREELVQARVALAGALSRAEAAETHARMAEEGGRRQLSETRRRLDRAEARLAGLAFRPRRKLPPAEALRRRSP